MQRDVLSVPWNVNAHTVPKKVCPSCPRFYVSDKESVYLDPVSHGNSGWPVETIVDGSPDIENVTDALRSGPYGKCVYESDNDVCDHQVSSLSL